MSAKRGSHSGGGGVKCERHALCHMKRFGVLIRFRFKSAIKRRLIRPRRRENMTRGFLRSVLFFLVLTSLPKDKNGTSSVMHQSHVFFFFLFSEIKVVVALPNN